MGSASSKESQAPVSAASPVADGKNAIAKETENSVSNQQQQPLPQEEQGGGGGGGGCPMKRSDGSYSYDWRAIFHHNSKGSTQLNKDDVKQQKDGSFVRSDDAPKSSQAAAGGGGCPVKEYNVYSQPIDSTNQMPSVANQLPAPGQNEELSTERVKSSITKGGAAEGTTWTYPSPQMFFNALSRKGKLDDTKEKDMESIVAIHNNMNEKTWSRVLEWERVLDPDSTPKLLKFMGRPADLSPKATIKHYLFGHPLPYDRHDWTVLRSDGTTVRYVIDYYHDETRASDAPESATPSLKDHNATPSLLVDVRPAVDSPVLAWNRLVSMPYAKHIDQSTDYQMLPFAPTAEMKSQVQESLQVFSNIKESVRQKQKRQEMIDSISEDDAKNIAKTFSEMLRDCQEARAKMESSESEEEQQRATLDLTICMAKIVCPQQHAGLVKAVGTDDESSVESALDQVTGCVATNTSRRSAAKKKYPHVFN